MITDSHCHLNFKELYTDIDGVLERALEAGVGLMQTVCTKMSDVPAIRDLAEKHANIYYSVGVHPNEVTTEEVLSVDQLIELASHPKAIGLGETGLDYHFNHSDRCMQRESFLNHIAASRISGLPVIIHNRDSDQDMIDILRQEMAKGEFKALLHCFTGSEELARAALELGVLISISGIVTFKNAESLRAIVKTVPLDSLLVETDAPYLAPVPHRGKPNEPSFVLHTVEYLAELLGVSAEELARVTTANFLRVFTKVRPEAQSD
jgi:TatD DNase family protein